MDLTYYVRVLHRNWRLLALVVICSIAGAAAAAWLQTPLYTASTTLVATVDGAGVAAEESAQRQVTTQRAATLAQFASTAPVVRAVAEAAADATGMPARPPAQVTAAADGVSPFLTITVTDSSPRWAQAVANAYETAMPAALSPIDRGVALAAEGFNVLTPAALPQQPSSPDRMRYVLMGLLLGVVLGLGIVVLREAFDRQVADPEDVGRALALPVLGAVPQENPKRALPMRSAPHSARAEAYRAVVANLPFLSTPDDSPQAVMITGTERGEGVTTLAANLALALARSGRRVLLVDANLRAPRLHEVFDVPAAPGLAELLAGTSSLDEVAHVVDGGSLRVVTAGELPEDPVERLTSARAGDVFAHLGKDSDVVIFDAPPVVPVADALFLVRQVGAVVLTTRVRLTRKDALRRAGDALYQVRAPLAGVVVNGAAGRSDRLRPSRRHGHAQPGRTIQAMQAPTQSGADAARSPGFAEES